jgi:hypothetical protein
VTGRITGLRPDVEVTVGVLSVTALEQSTTLAYQLTAAGDTRTGGEYVLDSPRSGIQLVSRQAGQRFFVESFASGSFAHCVCSERPIGLGSAPVFQYAAYPPLPASVTEVEVQVPGLKPVTVPVTRR